MDERGYRLRTAGAAVHEIVIELLRAAERSGSARLFCLFEAQRLARELDREIDEALRAEIESATPTILASHIRKVIERRS